MISHFDCEFCYDFTVSVSAETFEIGRTETEPKYRPIFRPNFCFGRTLFTGLAIRMKESKGCKCYIFSNAY